ncbi:flagellar hook-length control protein FliK [Acidovorax sp. GBBC 3334]|uniref:flagellar hook-length control protein FliK n=1 Tax=Acidovorax sp. GBBC 3334 TaxID=2940496 RepID=UPI0023046E5D|nr:flagellar hook-length control protein FliK [Acidovorax sp. GBBC 3334]MDA8455898.1 flagellar hook-length control protein FliK [Acidovorax sp. GBBC 3334]
MNTDTQNRIARGPSSSHASHEARGTRGAAKTAGAQGPTEGTDAAAAGQGGFSMLLASLGADLGAGDALAGAAAGAAGFAADDPLLPGTPDAGLPGGTSFTAADPSALALQGMLPTAMASGWPGVGGGIGTGAVPGTGVPGFGQASRAVGLMDASSLVGQTALIDGAADGSAGAAAGSGKGLGAARAGMARGAHSAMGSVGAPGQDAAIAAAGSGFAVPVHGAKGEGTVGLADSSAALQSAAASLAGAERREAGAPPAGSHGAGRGSESNLQGQAAGGGAEVQATALPVPARTESSPSLAAAVERSAASGVADGAHSPDGSAGTGSDSAVGMADPSQVAMEDQIAEQVAYWVHQKTQNAELTIDRDGQPVEISVSLSGNEAHVAFRSDQSQTRDLLDTSVAQLRELLRSEGLELAGVSVGQSGGNGAGDASGRQSPRGEGARVTRVQSGGGQPSAPAAVARPTAHPDRTLDVFV